MKAIRVGVIGCGYWGPNLVRNFVELPTATVVAVSDLKEDRLAHIQKRYPDIQVTKNYNQFFNMNLDAVVIASPPDTHFKIAQKCLQNGCHVMIEKPMTLTCSDGEQLLKTAKENERVVMVGHIFLYNAAVQTLKEIIERGDIGDVYYADSARLNLGLFQPKLNVLWDLAPHDISILLYLFGQNPMSVHAEGMTCVRRGVHDNVYMNLVFPNNLIAHVHVSWLDPCKVRRVTVIGSKKMVVYNDLDTNERIKIYDQSVETPAYTNGFEEFSYNYRYGDILSPNIRFEEPLKKECQDFIDSITNHHEPKSNGLDGLRVVKVLEAAQRSLESRKEEVLEW